MRSTVVIGAGPAGSLAATLLARAGWAVTLVERQTFPRDKVCGECLSTLGLSVLDRAGLLPRLRARGMIRLRRAGVWSTAGRHIELQLPSEMGGLSRAVLDVELRDAAREAGATLLQPARCEHIEPGKQPGVRVRDTASNRILDLHTDVVIVADGKGGQTAGILRPKNGDLGVKCHLANVNGPADAIELFGLRGHYVGLAPIDTGRWNLAMSVPKKRVREFDGDFDRLLDSVCRQNAALGERLREATRESAWLSSPLPRYGVARHWPVGIVPVGNAAAALEPIGGEGMGLALRSAEMAVERLSAPSPFRTKLLKDEFRRLWTERRTWCRIAAITVASPFAAVAAIEIADGDARLTHWMAAKMGKAAVLDHLSTGSIP